MTFENRHCFTRNERLLFCRERDDYRKIISDQIISEKLPSDCVQVKCQNCKNPFYAKKKDRLRGWGRFCSKSCKAQHR